jgi:hypothetical protein
LHFDEIFSLEVLSTQTSFDDLEASLHESLTSPAIETYEHEELGRRFSTGSDLENTPDVISKQVREVASSQEPTPTEKEPVFDIGEA